MFKRIKWVIVIFFTLLAFISNVCAEEEEGEYEVYILYRDSHSIYPVTFEQILVYAALTGQFLPGHTGILIVSPDGHPYIIDTFLGEGIRKIPLDEAGIHIP